MFRLLPLFALFSLFATTVESNMEGDIMVTCNVDEGTRIKGDCTESVWDEIEAALLQCSFEGMDLPASQTLDMFKVDWKLNTSRTRRNLRQERDLRRCTGTCYTPRSSCCLLHSSFCASKCTNCSCDYRRLSEKEEIENVLANSEPANEDSRHDERRLLGGREDVIATCVATLEALRVSLLARNNLCMGDSITAAITCDANLYGEEESNNQIDCESPYSPFYCNSESLPAYVPLSDRVCLDFAVHAGTAVTLSGVVSTIQGGLLGGTSVTGTFVEAAMQTATTEESMVFAAHVLDEHAAAMKVRPYEKVIGITEIGGMTFTPGMYRAVGSINLAHGTVVTLDGQGDEHAVFVFRAGTTLTTAADTSFILKNGAKAENVLWALGTGATLGANSVLEGSIMAGTAITMGTTSELHGCALAQTFVSFAGNGSVIVPSPIL
jgi:hypothetical protein